MKKVRKDGYHSIAFPLLGTGTGGFSSHQALGIILNELKNEIASSSSPLFEINIVLFGGEGSSINVSQILNEVFQEN